MLGISIFRGFKKTMIQYSQERQLLFFKVPESKFEGFRYPARILIRKVKSNHSYKDL